MCDKTAALVAKALDLLDPALLVFVHHEFFVQQLRANCLIYEIYSDGTLSIFDRLLNDDNSLFDKVKELSLPMGDALSPSNHLAHFADGKLDDEHETEQAHAAYHASDLVAHGFRCTSAKTKRPPVKVVGDEGHTNHQTR